MPWSLRRSGSSSVDGIVEEITTAISRLPRLFVIACNSSFTYKGKAVRNYVANTPKSATAAFRLPPILSLRCRGRLPLQIRDRIGSAAGKWYEIFDVAGACAGRPPTRRARMLPLKFVRNRRGPMLVRRSEAWAKSERAYDRRDNRDYCQFRDTGAINITVAPQKMTSAIMKPIPKPSQNINELSIRALRAACRNVAPESLDPDDPDHRADKQDYERVFRQLP